MSAPKTRPTEASVNDFLATQPETRRADCEVLAAMMQAATGEPAVMWGDSIVGFGRHPQRYAGGKSMDWPLLGFSPRKSELSLYLMPGLENQQALLARLGRHRTGKSCLSLTSL